MSSNREHNVVKSFNALAERVRALPEGADKAPVLSAVEDLRDKLAAVGYELRPG